MRTAFLVGNSDGIGLALTRLLLEEGWSVIGISRSASVLSEPAYRHHVLDVRDPGYTAAVRVIAEQTRIDVCVYCAGTGEFLEFGAMARERGVFETNLLGAVSTIEAILPGMIARKGGHFIGLSSQADGLIDAHAPSYAASKAGLSSYLEGLALASRPHGVAVTNLRFGFVDTKLAKASTRPFLLTPQQAARRIRHNMERRPMRDTYPKRMALLLWAFRTSSTLRRWFT